MQTHFVTLRDFARVVDSNVEKFSARYLFEGWRREASIEGRINWQTEQLLTKFACVLNVVHVNAELNLRTLHYL